MKTTHIFLSILAVCVVALAGCKKSDESAALTQAYHGINVDWQKFDAEFANAGQDVQDSVNGVKRFFRYAQFTEALMELDKLSNNPNLTEPQKKQVSGLIEQTRQVITKAPTPGQ